MKGTVIIDGNSLCHAAHNSPILTVGTMQTQAIIGTIKSMRVIMKKYPGWNILVLWDGRAQWRFDLYPAYKGNRDAKNAEEAAKKAAYKAQFPFVKKALELLGIRQMMALTHEADDLAGLMSKRLSAGGTKIELVTGDQDWLQLVNENVNWFDPIRDNYVGLENFTKFTGFLTPLEFLEGKALMGDTSDCIKGVGGIGAETAPLFLAEFKSVPNFYLMVDSGQFTPKLLAHTRLCGSSPFTKDEWITQFDPDEEDRASEKIAARALAKHTKQWPGQGRLLYARNMKLMDLQQVPPPASKDIVITATDYNEEKFLILCEKLSFMSIRRNFEDFIQPFRKHNSSRVS